MEVWWIIQQRETAYNSQTFSLPSMADLLQSAVLKWQNFLVVMLLSKHQFSSVAQSCPTLRNPMNGTTPGLPVHYHPYGRKWRGTKKPLDESESREWKSRLKVQHSENEDHGILSHHFMGNRWGNSGNSVRLYFGGAPNSLQMVIAAMKLKEAYSLEGKLWPT